jgi:CRP-like cAMP-binding protein
VFFILKGRVKIYYDINEGYKDQVVNIPFNLYVEGSYFGDSDVLVNAGRDGRDGTAVAETEC